jgi:hypothetical protein
VSFDKTGKEEAPALAGALQLVVIVMDYGFLAIAVLVFPLNHGLAVGMFVLLYDGAIAVMRLANRDASAGRPGMNSNIVSIRWGGYAEHNRRCNQIFLHVSLSSTLNIGTNVGGRYLFRRQCGDQEICRQLPIAPGRQKWLSPASPPTRPLEPSARSQMSHMLVSEEEPEQNDHGDRHAQ